MVAVVSMNLARSGIAYFPNLNDYLSDNNVSGLVLKAVSSGDPKMLMSMSATDWKTEQAKPFYRRGRAMLPPPPYSEESQSRRSRAMRSQMRCRLTQSRGTTEQRL